MKILKWRRINKSAGDAKDNAKDSGNGNGNSSDKWICQNLSRDRTCLAGPDKNGICQTGHCNPVRTIRAKRDIFSLWIVLLVISALAIGLTLSGSNRFLMPGPLISAHSSIENCTACHASIPKEHFGWLRTVLSDATPKRETQACLTCHKMSKQALNPHGVNLDLLSDMSRKARSSPAVAQSNFSSNVGRALFPVGSRFKGGVHCTTCHKEHKGQQSGLKFISDARCQSCHKRQFESFQSGHPEFKKFPAKRRTRINFDHNSHFGKHIPKLIAERDQSKKIPKHCTSCHKISGAGGHMAVKPFEEICASCHLNQILGTERASGPKGIAFLTLPGLDVASLRKKGADIGEWPEASEADVTPFMNLLMGGDDDQRKLMEYVEKLDLLDLENSSKDDISIVENFVWQIKRLIHTLSASGVSQPLKKVVPVANQENDSTLIARLTATLPRDILISTGRDWLPNLASEIKKYKGPKKTALKGGQKKPAGSKPASPGQEKPWAGKIRSRGRVTTNAGQWRINELGELIKGDEPAKPAEAPRDDQTTSDNIEQTKGDAIEPVEKPNEREPNSNSQNDSEQDLEKNIIAEKDAEGWAESGGWYRQDHSIFYLPTGHGDSFMRAWLDFSGRAQKKGESDLKGALFSWLTEKDTPGQCVKCHSVDKSEGDRLSVKWQPASPDLKKGRFTSFSHRPHIGLNNKRGCMTCHEMDRAANSQETYKSNNPAVYSPNFKQIEAKQCRSCHVREMVKDDCQLCHKYHVKGVTTPTMTTILPGK